MIALDTNLLARYCVEDAGDDDPQRTGLALGRHRAGADHDRAAACRRRRATRGRGPARSCGRPKSRCRCAATGNAMQRSRRRAREPRETARVRPPRAAAIAAAPGPTSRCRPPAAGSRPRARGRPGHRDCLQRHVWRRPSRVDNRVAATERGLLAAKTAIGFLEAPSSISDAGQRRPSALWRLWWFQRRVTGLWLPTMAGTPGRVNVRPAPSVISTV